MSTWRETCEEIAEEGRRSEPRPWVLVPIAGSGSQYALLATNNADRLARFATKLAEHVYSKPHSHREEFLARLWQESRDAG